MTNTPEQSESATAAFRAAFHRSNRFASKPLARHEPPASLASGEPCPECGTVVGDGTAHALWHHHMADDFRAAVTEVVKEHSQRAARMARG